MKKLVAVVMMMVGMVMFSSCNNLLDDKWEVPEAEPPSLEELGENEVLVYHLTIKNVSDSSIPTIFDNRGIQYEVYPGDTLRISVDAETLEGTPEVGGYMDCWQVLKILDIRYGVYVRSDY